MVKLTSNMKEMLKNQLSFLSTTDGDNNPQVGPKGSMRILDDEHLLYDEHTGKHAWNNIHVNPEVAVAVVDHNAYKGFRFEGKVEIHQGDQIYKDAEKYAADNHIPHPIAAVVIKIERILYLDAGKKAGEPVE
jgi:uncharacterized protein